VARRACYHFKFFLMSKPDKLDLTKDDQCFIDALIRANNQEIAMRSPSANPKDQESDPFDTEPEMIAIYGGSPQEVVTNKSNDQKISPVVDSRQDFQIEEAVRSESTDISFQEVESESGEFSNSHSERESPSNSLRGGGGDDTNTKVQSVVNGSRGAGSAL